MQFATTVKGETLATLIQRLYPKASNADRKKIAARVRITARRVVFHLASSCPYEPLFRHALSVLCDSG